MFFKILSSDYNNFNFNKKRLIFKTFANSNNNFN